MTTARKYKPNVGAALIQMADKAEDLYLAVDAIMGRQRPKTNDLKITITLGSAEWNRLVSAMDNLEPLAIARAAAR